MMNVFVVRFNHRFKRLVASLCWGMVALSNTAIPSFAAGSEEPQESFLPLEQTVYIYLDTGTVVVQLAPFIAPKHVEQFKALVKEGFYDGLDLYRVIDGFVAQGGDVTEKKSSANRANLKAEFTRPLQESSTFHLLQAPAFLAEQTGFINGFAAGRSLEDKQEWLIHCPGALAMARDNGADTGSTDFYIVIGQAPRHLDRNMSVFGQVVSGLQYVQSAQRGDRHASGGVITEPTMRTKILSAKLAIDVPESKRLRIALQHSDSVDFQKRVASARSLNGPFYHYKGTGNLDVCYYRPSITVR